MALKRKGEGRGEGSHGKQGGAKTQPSMLRRAKKTDGRTSKGDWKKNFL